MISPDEAARALLLRRAARRSLLQFTRSTHPSWQDSSSGHHEKICAAIERLFRREIHKLMISAPPRHGKTELATRRGPAWMLGQNPSMQLMAITHSDDLARDNGADVLGIIKDPIYQRIFPGVTLRTDSQAAGRWRTEEGGIYYAAGIGGGYTGRGYDCLAAGSPVITKRGLIPIEHIRIGDLVLTHRNRWRQVMAFACRGRRYVLRLGGNGVDLACTPDHRIWIGEQWIRADEYVPRMAGGVVPVYDISVLEDESFFAGGLFCHNCGIIDDPYKNRAEADSERIREITWRRYWGDFKTRQQPNAGELLMGTRWRPDDLFGRLLELEGTQENGGEWFHLVLPAIGAEGSDQETALWEERFSLEELRKVRDGLLRAQRSREWNSQYQQHPTVEEGTYCLRKWFTERWSEIPKGCRIYIASDYAVTDAAEGRDPDWTEHGVFGYAPDGRLYVLDWWSGQTAPDEWISSLIALADRWKPSCAFARKGGIRNSVEPLMTRLLREHQVHLRREWMSDAGDKAEKGRSFQGMASMGRVVFPKTMWAERVVDQCVDFPGCQHDDAFDVMANMCGAIDSAHPGIVQAPPEPQIRDKWRKNDDFGLNNYRKA